MFCPQCKAEYRPGFSRCADCDVDLVYELPPAAEPPPEPLESFWIGDDQEWFQFLCAKLKSAEIPFETRLSSREVPEGVIEKYEITVQPSLAYQASRYISEQAFNRVYDEEDDKEGPLSIPEDPAAPVEVAPRDYKPWFAEDATAEVFSEPVGSAGDEEESKAGMIEMSLRENLIQSRTEDSNGSRKVFVLPEDEPRAREIVREVTTGSPPP